MSIFKKIIANISIIAMVGMLFPMQIFAQDGEKSKNFYTSNGYEFKVFFNEQDGVDINKTKELLVFNQDFTKIIDNKYEIFSINGEDVLFIQIQDGKNTPTKVFTSKVDSSLKDKFKNGTTLTKEVLDNIDLDNAIVPSWVDKNKLEGKRVRYNEVGNDGYTVKTQDFGWFYAPKKQKIEDTPTESDSTENNTTNIVSDIKTTLFYTSNNNKLPVVLSDDVTVDFEESKKLLESMIPTITDNDIKQLAENLKNTLKSEDVEIKVIEGEKILFVKTAPNTTKAFRATESNEVFKNAFGNTKPGTEKGEPPIKVDLKKAIFAKWVNVDSPITHYHKTDFGYTLLNEDGHWFYAPFETTPFYTSNDNPFPVVLKDEKTIDLDISKKIFQNNIEKITNEKDKKLAEDFIKNATDSDVKIIEIEGKTLLFVKVDSNTTKVFHKEPSTHLKNNFKHSEAIEGIPSDVDFDNKISPDWILDHTDVIYYKSTNEGYTLLTKAGHWYYAKKKVSKPTSSGSGSGSGGGGSISSSSQGVVYSTYVENKLDDTKAVKSDLKTIKPVVSVIFAGFSKKCAESVLNLTDNRLISYYDNLKIVDQSDKNRFLTRAEFLKLLLNAANIDVSNEELSKYSDVSEKHTLNKYISYATRVGIVSGQDNKFRPNDIITRAEVAKIVINSAGIELSKDVNTFSDVNKDDPLAIYIQTAFDNCILNGRKTLDGQTLLANNKRVYEPNSPVTLSETAKILFNISK